MRENGADQQQLVAVPVPDAEVGAEIALVRYALRARYGTQAAADPDSAASRNVDVVSLCETMKRNKLLLLLSDPILSALPRSKREAFRCEVERYKERTVVMNVRVLSDTVSVSQMFAKERIAFVVMKGVAQQTLHYGDYFSKPAGDVDVLVNASDYGRTRDLLETRGFKVAEACRSFWWRYFLGEQHMVKAGPPPGTVDLHFRLQQPGSPGPRDPGAFIRERETIEIAGVKVPVISRMYRPILSAMSIAKALFNREACGGHALDFYAATKDMNRDEQRALIKTAEQQGLGNTVLLGFRVAALLLGEGTDVAKAKVLDNTSDSDLAAMVLAPWCDTTNWPHRRDVLRDLCGRSVVRYVGEVGWAASADLCRRWFERAAPSSARQSFPGAGA